MAFHPETVKACPLLRTAWFGTLPFFPALQVSLKQYFEDIVSNNHFLHTGFIYISPKCGEWQSRFLFQRWPSSFLHWISQALENLFLGLGASFLTWATWRILSMSLYFPGLCWGAGKTASIFFFFFFELFCLCRLQSYCSICLVISYDLSFSQNKIFLFLTQIHSISLRTWKQDNFLWLYWRWDLGSICLYIMNSL